MPVGLIVENALAEPDDPRHVQIVAQIVFHPLATQQGVAIDVQQTLFGDESGPFAIDVDRASLIHDGRAIAVPSLDLEHFTRDQVILVPGEIQAAL